MAIQTLNTIKNWFKTSLKPSQAQFWDTWDSFRHKFEKVPVKDIDGIDELLLTKADKTILDNHLADKIAHAPQVNTDWNSESGLSQLINKPEFKTINGEPIVGNGDISLEAEGVTFDQVLSNGNETNQTVLFKSYGDNDVYTNTISAQNIEMTQSSTVTRGENKTASLTLNSELIDFVNSNTGETTALFAQGVGFGNLNSNHFSTLEMNPATTANYSNVLMPAITTEEETKTLATLDDIPTVSAVSETQSGIVDNTSLQELGGADKLVNGVRIGRGGGNDPENSSFGLSALNANTTGTGNTAIGSEALLSNISANNNTGIGNWALRLNETSPGNTALGVNTLTKLVSGIGFNTAVGTSALTTATTASYSTAVGTSALRLSTTGTQNVAIGGSALRNLTTGNYNLGIGTNALLNNIIGIGNVAVGTASSGGTLGNYNTALGWQSGTTSTLSGTGDHNITIGFQSGMRLTTGAGNVLIGTPPSNADMNYATGNNNISINTGFRVNGIVTGSSNTIIGGVQGLSQDASDLVILANGIGVQAIRKEADNRLLAPTLTNTLIDSGGAKSLITKEYVDETKQVKDNQIMVSGNETVQENWNGQTIIFAENGKITVPETLPVKFSFNAITMPAVTVNWAITTPFVWLFGEPNPTPEKTYLNFTRVGSTNNIILSV